MGAAPLLSNTKMTRSATSTRTTTRPTRRPAWLAAAAMAAALGCRLSPRSPTQQEVVAAVHRYNDGLQQAYARSDANVLGSVATADEVRRVDDLIGFLGQGGIRMEARQERIELAGVHVDADAAAVDVTQVWWYRHRVRSTGEVTQPPKRVRYRTRYELVRLGGQWLVDRLRETGYEELR